eukprot:1075165-Rhodomonas_salina.1
MRKRETECESTARNRMRKPAFPETNYAEKGFGFFGVRVWVIERRVDLVGNGLRCSGRSSGACARAPPPRAPMRALCCAPGKE